MDCQMPEMNGYEATAAIRRGNGPNQSVPIVAMTADVVTSGRQRSLDAGMSDYISKPIELDDLATHPSHLAAPRACEGTRIRTHRPALSGEPPPPGGLKDQSRRRRFPKR